MTLRPRYSLLTLLILTALVAGGVKLWYGPHHVVMRDPRMVEEQAIVESFPLIGGFFRPSYPQFEYGYYSSWQGKQVTYLLRRFDLQETMAFLHGDRDEPIRKLTAYDPSQKFLDTKPTPPEHILVCLEVTPAARLESLRNVTGKAPPDQDEELKNLFFLSSHRRLYRMTGWERGYLPVEEVTLDTIPIMAARDCASSEFAKIPLMLQRPFTIKPAIVLEEAAVFTATCTVSHALFMNQVRQIEGTD